MALRSIKKLEITCDTCGKIVATGQTSTQVLNVLEADARYTEIHCTECRKLPHPIDKE